MSLELTHILTVVGAVILMAVAERRRLARLFRRYVLLGVLAPVQSPLASPVLALPSDPRQLVNQRGLTLTCWSFPLNEQPDHAPHALLVGPSGAGKTMFTRALLACRTGQCWC